MNKDFTDTRNFDILEVSEVIKIKLGLQFLFCEGKPEPMQNGLKAQHFPEAFCYHVALNTSLVLCSIYIWTISLCVVYESRYKLPGAAALSFTRLQCARHIVHYKYQWLRGYAGFPKCNTNTSHPIRWEKWADIHILSVKRTGRFWVS